MMCKKKDVLVTKMFTNGQNMDKPFWAKLKKQYWVGRHWLSCGEKVPAAAASKKGDTDNVLRHEKIPDY